MGEHEIESGETGIGETGIADQPTRAKRESDFERMALRELRQARRLLGSDEDEGMATATLRVSTANVLAILELASAIRKKGENGEY